MFIVVHVAAYPVTVVKRTVIRFVFITDKMNLNVIGHSIRKVVPADSEVIWCHLPLVAEDVDCYIVVDVTNALDYSQVIRHEMWVDDEEGLGRVLLHPLQDVVFSFSTIAYTDIAFRRCFRAADSLVYTP